MGKGKSLILGFIVGGVVSATATLFTTPASGQDIKSQAKVRGEKFKGTLSNLRVEGRQLTDQIAQTSKEGATLLKDLSEDVKTSIDSWRETIEPHQRNIQRYLHEIEDSLKDLEEKTPYNRNDENE